MIEPKTLEDAIDVIKTLKRCGICEDYSTNNYQCVSMDSEFGGQNVDHSDTCEEWK